ncbi:hypothetical protein GPECTOR_6g827 [Gonium pectorale]|uniref:Serine aminopeptidase S33 domain-containing protein n=1 Tax=Gonium pectorale TaxID=33097 RepID=A0A150GVP1_GONPE|nr:hypothetical protein GPECTOR_6g827 [Gonium pectorale]|eukprot:KXZ53909.1 hypothetical protein GPECTOR_6g827 [Gonium pectorale]
MLGSGLSEGQWVTLGCEEVEDVGAAVEYLRSSGRVSTLGLWGRSMGAVTALLYSQRDPSIAGMVLDSPFSRLTDLMMEIVAEQRLPVPRPLAKLALAAMRRSVSKRAGFDITKVSPVDAVSQSFIPALFGHATGDTFIRISHAETLHSAYAGDKNLIRFEGDHNSRRPEFFYNSVSIFWHNTLQLEHLLEPAVPPQTPAGAPSSRAGVGIPLAPPPRALQPPPQRAALTDADQQLAGSPGAGDLARVPSSGVAAASPSLPSGVDGGAAEGGEDVALTGTTRRSAPWEPRMWEWELDRAERERQRFRRMAGGLSMDGSADGQSNPGGPDMDLANLLGLAEGAAGLDGLGGGDSPGGLRLLPGSEEEEEAQLMAALQLSLLDAVMTGSPPTAGGNGANADMLL